MDEAIAAARFRTALELHEFGVALMLQNLRRRMKGATEEQVREAHRLWLRSEAPDAPPAP
jgi:hypothetical protein